MLCDHIRDLNSTKAHAMDLCFASSMQPNVLKLRHSIAWIAVPTVWGYGAQPNKAGCFSEFSGVVLVEAVQVLLIDA